MAKAARTEGSRKSLVDYSKKYWWLAAVAVPIIVAIIGKYPFKSDTPVAGTIYIGSMTVIEHQYQQYVGQPLTDPDLKSKIEQANELGAKSNFPGAAALVQEVAQKVPVPAVLNNLGVLYQGAGDELPPKWKLVNPDPARWTMEPRRKAIMIITKKGPCLDMKDGKNLLLLDKQLPSGDFEVIVKASAKFQGHGNEIALILFNDELNYFWLPLQNRYPGALHPPATFVDFQKVFQGQVSGTFSASSSNDVYLKIGRDGNEYSGYFANMDDPEKPENVDQIQWTKLGTLPWIRFQGKLALCAVNSTEASVSPEVAANFYSVLIRKK
jgi:hypothetical protein